MVRNDDTFAPTIAGRMLQTNDQPHPASESLHVDLADLTDSSLVHAMREQNEAVQAAEQTFAEARAQLDAQRRRLRALQTEQRRRRGTSAGSQEGAGSASGMKRRSTTAMDAIYGRDGIDSQAELRSFRILSLQREEVVLDDEGDLANQAIRFVDKDTGGVHVARTFGEARALLESGHAPGQPDIPLQRQIVWYVEQGRQGRLRLDQMFVERRGDGT
jgi:hypothetical protein